MTERIQADFINQQMTEPDFSCIIKGLARYGIDELDEVTLRGLYEAGGLDMLQCTIVNNAKEGNRALPDEVGEACFGDDWEDGKFI